MPANIIVAPGGTISPVPDRAFGLTGFIDQLRFFTLTTPGVFNISDTDPPSHHPGDANGDGKVDIKPDLTIVLTHYNQSTGHGWGHRRLQRRWQS